MLKFMFGLLKVTNIIVVAHSKKELAEQIKVPEYSIRKCLNKNQTLANKVWIFAKYDEEFPEIPEFGTWEFDEFRNTQFKSLSNKEERRFFSLFRYQRTNSIRYFKN